MYPHTFGFHRFNFQISIWFLLAGLVVAGMLVSPLLWIRGLNFSPMERSSKYALNLSEANAYGTKSSLIRETMKGDSLLFYYSLPETSSVGELTFKMDPQELSAVKTLRIQARRVLGKAYPENFRLEMKSGDQTIRVFQGKMSRRWSWQQLDFPLRSAGLKGVYVDELRLVITHAKAAPKTQGALEIGGIAFW